MPPMIERKEYLSMLIENKDCDIIKVVTGVRRCGKSTLFALYIDWLQENGIAPDQIISVNLEALEYEALNDYHALYDYIKGQLCPDRQNYVFIDEVQNCAGFEKAVDNLFINYDGIRQYNLIDRLLDKQTVS